MGLIKRQKKFLKTVLKNVEQLNWMRNFQHPPILSQNKKEKEEPALGRSFFMQSHPEYKRGQWVNRHPHPHPSRGDL